MDYHPIITQSFKHSFFWETHHLVSSAWKVFFLPKDVPFFSESVMCVKNPGQTIRKPPGCNLYDKSTREPLVVLRCSDTRPNGVPVPHELQVGRSTHGSGYITPIASSGMGIWSNQLWIGVSLIIFITWRIVATSLAGCWWRLILPNPKKNSADAWCLPKSCSFPKDSAQGGSPGTPIWNI